LAGSSNGTTTNSYYDSQTSGQNDTGKGIPKPTEYMQSENFAALLRIAASLLGFNSWEYSEGEYPKLSNAIAVYPGDGTEANPYVIETKAELEIFSSVVNFGISSYIGKYLKLGNNIALNDTTNWRNWATDNADLEQWTPIGMSSNLFRGTFDGDGHIVSGVYINSNITNNYSQGLFGYLNGGTIKNLGVVASYIKGNGVVGGLVGYINGGTITNSYATGNVQGGQAGGLVGTVRNNDRSTTSTISNSYATGNVSGNSGVGGLVGDVEESNGDITISNSYATGDVVGNNYVGGLVGAVRNYDRSTISNSYATGDVVGNSYLGGLVGFVRGAGGDGISNSYATGNVIGTNYVGGLVGEGRNTIRNSYAIGRVIGSSDAGGLVGYSGNSINSYYDLQTSGQNDTGKGTGLPTDEMKNILTYFIGNWDLDSTWAIAPPANSGYPILQYQLANTQRISKSQAYLVNQRQKNDTIPTVIEYRTGNPIQPQVDSVVFNTKLTQGTDYEVFYSNNINIGSAAKIIIQGKGGFIGAKIIDFYITDFRNINNATVAAIPDQLETGGAIEYKPSVKDYSNAVTLNENTDYILVYENNISAGEATIYIIGQGIYDGTEKIVTFNIVGAKQLTLANTTVTLAGAQSYVYSGIKITPEATAVYNTVTGTITLEKDIDYTVSYGDNTNAGTGTVNITGIGNYAGTVSKTFKITAIPLETPMLAAPIPPQEYTGYAVQPEVTLTHGGKTLVLGTDYTVSYLNNIYPSEQATIRITGTGNYSGTINRAFTISGGDIEKTQIAVVWHEPLVFEYNGQNHCPSATATLPNGLPLNLNISCTAVNAREESYTATATYPNIAYELLNSTINFTITQAPIAATLEISNITAGAALSKMVKGIKENPTINYWYSASKNGAYNQTTPTAEGVYYAYATVSPTTNYQGSVTDTISFSIYKPDATPIQVSWSGPYTFEYSGSEQGPSASASHGGISFPLIVKGATEAGTHTATAKFQTERTDYKLANETKEFTITPKPFPEDAIEPIGNFFYTGLPIRPENITVKDGGKVLAEGIDYTVSYDENTSLYGTVTVSGIGNYSGTASRQFQISSDGADIVPVVWGTERTFAYDGTEHAPVATASNLELEIIGKQTDAGSHTAVAQLKNPNLNIVLTNASMPYTITKKPLQVSWTPEREFVYNKMVQVPIPNVEDANIVLRVVNGHSAAGVYEGVLAPFAQIVSSNAGNYELSGHIIDKYEIKQKPLKPYFAAILPPSDFNPSTDTLWVPYEVFNDSAALLNALNTLIDYDGFATDTVSKESDNANVLRGTPRVTLQYTETSPFMLAKRVETTQKATATIVTEEVSADNYTLTRPAIVIMATIEEDENAGKISCRIGNNCVEFSEVVCLAVSGQVVETCEIKVACVINGVCVESTPLETCSLVGETVPSCEDVPIQRPVLSGGAFRVWQTASGVVNVDLGYMPTTPTKLQIYDLKGNLVATEQVSTRFANIMVGVPSGVYLFKVGGRALKTAVLQ